MDTLTYRLGMALDSLSDSANVSVYDDLIKEWRSTLQSQATPVGREPVTLEQWKHLAITQQRIMESSRITDEIVKKYQGGGPGSVPLNATTLLEKVENAYYLLN